MSAAVNKDIVLDKEAFDKARSDFENLADRVNSLHKDITAALAELAEGFQTRAGDRFMAACRENLLKQMEKQAQVVKHLADTLNSVNSSYASVFSEYEQLNTTLSSYTQ